MSYLTLRQLIGLFGMALPLLCAFFAAVFSGYPLQPSVSAYYHTNARDLFVGLLVCVGFFLVTYRGYDPIDDIVATAAGIAAMGIAVFPCLGEVCPMRPAGLFRFPAAVSDKLHLASAVSFFLLCAANSLFLFTRTDKRRAMTRNKVRRNRIYVACGLVMILAMGALAAAMLLLDRALLLRTRAVFWVELLMLAAFGVSWLTKGESILPDREGPRARPRRS